MCETLQNLMMFIKSRQITISILCVLFIFLLPNDTFGEDSDMDKNTSHQLLLKLNQYNGLTSSKVTDILKDDQGFIWIATNNGLNRYDSQSIKNYFTEAVSKDSKSNQINCLFQSKEGTIYAGTKTGVSRYDLPLDRFIREDLYATTGQDTVPVYSIVEDNSGTIYFGTHQGIIVKKDNHYKQLIPEEHRLLNGTPLLSFDQDSLLWICHNTSGIFTWNTRKNQLNQFELSIDTLDGNIYNNIQDITIGPDGDIWIAVWGKGLWQINPKKKTYQVFRHQPNDQSSPNSDQIKSITFDPYGKLWIGYEEAGLDYFIPGTETFHHFYDPISKHARYEEPSIYKVFIDSDYTMWLGFRNDGIQAHSLLENPFRIYANPIDELGYQVFCLEESSDNQLIAGVKGAIDILDIKSNRFQRFNMPRNETPVSICQYMNGEFLVATYNDNVYRFNSHTGKFSPQFIQNAQDSSLYLNKLRLVYYIPEQDYFLLGSFKGLYKIDVGPQKSIHKILNHWIHFIYKDDSESMYWALPYGNPIVQINFNTLEIQNFNFNITKDIKAFTKHQENLFIGTDLGFYKINLATHKVAEINEIFPYPNLQINGMVKDDNTGIWCSSFESIIYYNFLDEDFRTFDKTDRLPSIRFRDGVAFRLSNGNIALGGQGGIIIFDPQKLNTNKNKANLQITGLKIHNHPVIPGEKNSPLKSNISITEYLKLKNHQSNITLDFSLLSYNNPSKHRFRYKIKGINESWVDLGSQNQITFNNLKTGTYRLILQAANHDNQWSSEKTITLEVLPPFYQTWYAFLVYLIIIVMIFLLYFRANKIREKVKQEMHTNELKLKNLQKLVNQENDFHQMKIRFFTNVSHELRTPISLIMAPLEKSLSSGLQPDKENLELMLRNAERLNRLVTQILDFRKMEVGKLELELSKGDFSDFCRHKAMLFLPMAQKKNLKYFMDIQPPTSNIYFDADKLEKIIYNLLSNAFKFTIEGSVSFSLKYTSSQLNQNEQINNYAEIKVSDTGKGITDEESSNIFTRFYSPTNTSALIYDKGTGIGLSLTQEMVKIHQGDISFSSDKEKGTAFIVRIPLDIMPKDSHNIHLQNPISLSLSKSKKEQSSLPHQADQEKYRVLFVDDNEDLRNYVKKEFEPEFSLLLATNGLEGIKTAKEELPDLIISDVQMPEMDGIEMCEIIRNNPVTSHIPIIILSAHESSAIKIKSFKNGIDDYITKPFSPDILLLKTRNLLHARKELQEKYSKELKLEANTLAITNTDEAFLNKVMAIIQENLSNEDFSVDFFADKIGMSRVHLYRKLKTLTGESVSEFVKTIRLKLAADLIRNKKTSVKETTYLVGFSDPKYFSKCFKQQFGIKPSDYAEQ